MNSKMRPFLDFYGEHDIIPTNLEIPNKHKFFQQRNFLLKALGIPPILVHGKNILEFGSGTGQKAVHLLSLMPNSYLAIDNNPKSVLATRDAIRGSHFSGTAEVIDRDFLEHNFLDSYDLVLAELILSTQNEPERLLRKLLDLTSEHGILIITCHDPISLLSETIRKAIVLNENLIDENLTNSSIRITKFFEQDLDHLKGMNRVRTDWAIDQLIIPWIGPLLSVPAAIGHVGSTAVFHGSSPKFVEDFRWYKDPELSVESLNENAIQNYWEKCHNLLDTRLPKSTRNLNLNKLLYAVCDELYYVVYTDVWTNDSHAKVLELCLKLKNEMGGLSDVTVNSVDAFIAYWQSNKVKHLQEFRPLWGRGSQYLSFIKSDSEITTN